MMRIQVVFNKDGTSQHTVKERSEGENCTLVYNMTSKTGTQESDEITGPDCAPNFENEIGGLVFRSLFAVAMGKRIKRRNERKK